MRTGAPLNGLPALIDTSFWYPAINAPDRSRSSLRNFSPPGSPTRAVVDSPPCQGERSPRDGP